MRIRWGYIGATLVTMGLAVAVACSSDGGDESPAAGPSPQTATPPAPAEPTLAPPSTPTSTPTAAPVPTQATPIPNSTSTAQPSPQTSSQAEVAGPSELPDDPRELMDAVWESNLDDVLRKMAYSGNTSYIPIIIDFMEFFQRPGETKNTLVSHLSRLNGDPNGFARPEQLDWGWWIEWLGNHPEIRGPDGYDAWKGHLYSLLDPEIGAFFYEGVKTNIRLEEIVWGGVAKDGIPDLSNPPIVSAEEATYLDPSDRVFGVSFNGEHRAYPLRILNPHEMANDVVGGVPFALAY